MRKKSSKNGKKLFEKWGENLQKWGKNLQKWGKNIQKNGDFFF